MWRTAAPCSQQRRASRAISSGLRGYSTSGWSQQVLGVAVMTRGSILSSLRADHVLVQSGDLAAAGLSNDVAVLNADQRPAEWLPGLDFEDHVLLERPVQDPHGPKEMRFLALQPDAV